MKKSFLVYHDNSEMFDTLNDEQLGKLFRSMYSYSKDSELKKLPKELRLVFISIRQQIDRNRTKWEKMSDMRSNFGKLGGLAKASKSKHKPVLLSKPTVKVKVKVKVKDKAIKKKSNSLNDNLKQPKIKEIAQKYSITEKKVQEYKDSYILWVGSNPEKDLAKGRNMSMTVQGWLHRDLSSGKIKKEMTYTEKVRAEGIKIAG